MKQLCEADRLASTFAIILACIGKNIYSFAKEKRFFYIDMLWFGTFCCLFGTFHCWSGNGIQSLERDHDFLEPITEVEPPLVESDHDFSDATTEVQPPRASHRNYFDTVTEVEPPRSSSRDFLEPITKVESLPEGDRNFSDTTTTVKTPLVSNRNFSDTNTTVKTPLVSDYNSSDNVTEIEPSLENDCRFFKAIIQIESGGNLNAVGDTNLRNHAFGPFQIRKPYYKDAVQFNRSLRKGKNFSNVRGSGSIKYSKRVIRSYMRRYATCKRLGRKPTYEDIARIHNGGPNGFKRNSTKPYWDKVRKAMKEQKNC